MKWVMIMAMDMGIMALALKATDTAVETLRRRRYDGMPEQSSCVKPVNWDKIGWLFRKRKYS